MARRLRIDPHGGRHHVMNRGVDRMTIFRDDADRRIFLGLLGEALTESEAHAEAYCLVGNHFHLVLRCPQGGLSAIMWKLSHEYARIFNHRSGRDGPVFRGRFHSKHVDSEAYLIHLVSYVHRNSLDLGVAPGAWKWSSYNAWMGREPAPPWLCFELARHVAGGPEQHRTRVERDDDPVPAVEPAGVYESWMANAGHRLVADLVATVDRVAPDMSAAHRRYAIALMADEWIGIPRDDLAPLVGAASANALSSRLRRARAALDGDPRLAALRQAVMRFESAG